VQAGLADGGCAAVGDLGLATTPAVFMACATEGFAYDGGIMLTASHLPPERNGMKFFTPAGGLSKADVTTLLERAEGLFGEPAPGGEGAPAAPEPFMAVYAEQLRAAIRAGLGEAGAGERPLEGLKVAVNAGHGSGGFFARDVLAPLGADVSASVFLEPNGDFPAHPPNPEHPDAVARTVEAVLGGGCDLGIVFDTDVDRSAVVDSDGQVLNRNRLIAAMAAVVLREHPGSTVVTDSVTSAGLPKFIAALGGRHLRYRRGYKNVIEKGVELNAAGEECHLMIETSGHGALKENYFLDDGAYMAVKLLVEAVRSKQAGGGGLGELIAALEEPREELEVRAGISADDFVAVGSEVIAAVETWVADAGEGLGWSPEAVNHEGLRVRVAEAGGSEGWFLVRQSLHDPVLVINFESSESGGLARTVPLFAEFLAARFPALDTAGLRVPGA
jgi:phosphomannomutase